MPVKPTILMEILLSNIAIYAPKIPMYIPKTNTILTNIRLEPSKNILNMELKPTFLLELISSSCLYVLAILIGSPKSEQISSSVLPSSIPAKKCSSISSIISFILFFSKPLKFSFKIFKYSAFFILISPTLSIFPVLPYLVYPKPEN